jgi:hypothetical protein
VTCGRSRKNFANRPGPYFTRGELGPLMLQRKSLSATLQLRAADAVGADVLKRPEYRLSLAAIRCVDRASVVPHHP